MSRPDSKTTAARRPVRWRRLFKRLLALAISVMVALVVTEGALRWMDVSYPLPYVPDRYCGSRLQPGLTALFTKEGRALVTINRAGHRDREHALQKPSDTFRIAVLGDSYAEAVQVEQTDTFWSVMERELGSCDAFAGKKVDVLNFGVSGYGTAQELQMLRHYVWDYNPDLVVLAVTTGNDLRDNSRNLSPNPVRPYFTLNEADESLILNNEFRYHPVYRKAMTAGSRRKVRWINRVRLLQLMRQLRADWNQPRQATATASEPGLDAVYSPPQSDDWQDAWKITERLIALMADEVADHGARFRVATLSNGIQVHPNRQTRENELKQLGGEDLFYADQRIADFCHRHSIPISNLAQRLQQHAEQNQMFLHGFSNTTPGTGHWNASGHRRAGELLASDLCRSQQDHSDKQSDVER